MPADDEPAVQVRTKEMPTLDNEVWSPATIHEIVRGWLDAERHKLEGLAPEHRARLESVLESADVHDAGQNHVRARFLYLHRFLLLAEVPLDTQWWSVSSLTTEHLDQLHVIGRCGWDCEQGGDNNELKAVARRKVKGGDAFRIETEPSTWRGLVLWGHSRGGPLTILEGNNRLLAAAATGTAFSIPVFVGLSQSYCFWHKLDPVTGPLLPQVGPRDD